MARRSTSSRTTGAAGGGARTPDGMDPRPWRARLEILVTIGLGLAAVATALSVYLTDQRDDEALLSFNEGVRKITEATGGYVEGSQAQNRDEALFIEYVDALQANDKTRAEYLLLNVMEPELRKSVNWWAPRAAATGEPRTPFVEENPFFNPAPQTAEADQLTEEGTAAIDNAKEEQDAGDRYIIASVILATALFLFGIAGVAHQRNIAYATFGSGSVIFLVAVVLMAVA